MTKYQGGLMAYQWSESQILRRGERVKVRQSVWVAFEESGVEMKEKFSQLVHFFRVSFQGEKMKDTLVSLNIGSKMQI